LLFIAQKKTNQATLSSGNQVDAYMGNFAKRRCVTLDEEFGDWKDDVFDDKVTRTISTYTSI